MSHDADPRGPDGSSGEEPDTTMLMAFADDALPADTATALARRIAADPRLAAQVGRFKADRALLRAAFDPVLAEPVPERLVAAIRARAAAPGAAEGRPALRSIAGGAGAVGAPACPRRSAGRAALPLALAASLALVLGFSVGRLVPGAGTGSEPGVAAGSLGALAASEPVQRLAETGAAGAGTSLPGGATALVLGTLERGPGRFCRELEIAGGPQPGLVLACRAAEGRWTPVALVALDAGPAASGFAPAGGEAEPDPLEALRAALGAVRLLDPEAEAAARARGWR